MGIVFIISSYIFVNLSEPQNDMKLPSCLCLLFLASNALAGQPDSLGIKIEHGRKYILHRVEEGEGLFAISRRYHVPVDSIKKANPQTKDGLVLGEVILVPVIEKKKVLDTDYHEVKEKETLYSLSREYNVPIEKLREWNHLKNNDIEIGQKLIIAMENESRIPVDSIKIERLKVDFNIVLDSLGKKVPEITAYKESYLKKAEEAKDSTGKLKQGWKEIHEEGMASWIDDVSISTKKPLALHKSAPPGTIIKVENMMNGRFIYVKVLGFLDEKNQTKTLITISKEAARILGIKDDFFRANVIYYIQESN